jgi:hypothetical protein
MEIEKNYQPLLETDGYCYINVQEFSNLKITWNLIKWFVKTYLKSIDIFKLFIFIKKKYP